MDQEGGDQGGGGGEVVDADEVIHQLVSEEVRKCIGKQFSKKRKVLREIKEKLEQHSEEEIELESLSSTKQVLEIKMQSSTSLNQVWEVP